ncbi:MAG: hybrid sensor histidine kinase/response regulator [Caulobacter sp.]|nr:hybrid sensor histidine kinase/response regulator [Caulobacter sp.]
MSGTRNSSPQSDKGQSADAARWFFENSRDLFCVAGLDGVLKEVNPAWTSVTGWTAEELIGRSPVELIHPDDRAAFKINVAELRSKGECVTIGRLKAKDGRWLWFDGRNQLSAEGLLIGAMRDITAERARDEELEAARRDHSMLGDAAGIGAWTYEPKTDHIGWSWDVLGLFGWSQEDIDSPEKFFEVLDPTQREAVAAAFERGVDTGQGATIEHRIRALDGRWLTMRATFRTEKRGKKYALKGISQNVTELAEARDAALRGQQRVSDLAEELTANSIRLKMALEAAEAGAFEVDHVKQTFWASDRFYDLVERRMSYEECRMPVWPFVHEEDRQAVEAVTAGWATGDTSQSMEFRIVLQGRRERWARIYYSLDMETLRGVGLILDIDARKRQELALVEAERQALAASDAKARFLANMSHELRTPMNGVLGIMHLLDREPLSDNARQLLSEALGCGRMLTTLLDDVIDFSRIEEGKLDLDLSPIDVGALATSVVRMLQPQAAEKAIGLVIEGAEGLGWARTDGVRLRQALFNLVGNAVKFTLQGQVTVRCERRGEQLCFAVEDTGVGIPLDAQAQLFQRFQQGDASTTRQFGGSGLGLAITRRLAELMGGDVAFSSAPGVGSTFVLTVTAPVTQPAQGEDDTPLDGMLAGLKVLVVEDNPTNQMIAVRLLETLGAEAAVAGDGLAGVDAAQSGLYDLILMDIQMPGIDGLEAARRIRALPAPICRTPIIALTANVMSHQKTAYLASGMDGVVSKPLSPAALLAEIVRLSQDPGDGEAARAEVA